MLPVFDITIFKRSTRLCLEMECCPGSTTTLTIIIKLQNVVHFI